MTWQEFADGCYWAIADEEEGVDVDSIDRTENEAWARWESYWRGQGMGDDAISEWRETHHAERIKIVRVD